jgi:hypothetical protein
MVRLMLVLAPVMCVLGGIAVSALLGKYMKDIDSGGKGQDKKTAKLKEGNTQGRKQEVSRLDNDSSKIAELSVFVSSAGTKEAQRSCDSSLSIDVVILIFETYQVAVGFVAMLTIFMVMYALHCTWVTSEAYSSPSIVLSARSYDGSLIIFDDFREAYYWLRMNTPPVSLTRQGLHVLFLVLNYQRITQLCIIKDATSFLILGCKNNVMVGLRISDNSYGQSNYISGQQYLEQYSHFKSGTSDGFVGR